MKYLLEIRNESFIEKNEENTGESLTPVSGFAILFENKKNLFSMGSRKKMSANFGILSQTGGEIRKNSLEN